MNCGIGREAVAEALSIKNRSAWVVQIRARVAGGSPRIGYKRSQTHKTRRDLEAELGAVQPVAAHKTGAQRDDALRRISKRPLHVLPLPEIW